MVRRQSWNHIAGPSSFPRCIPFRPIFLGKEVEKLNSNFSTLNTLWSKGLTRWTWFLFVSEGSDRILNTQALKNARERSPCSRWPLLRGTAVQWKIWKGEKEWGQGWASPASSGMMGWSRFVNRCQNWAGQGSLLQTVIMKASICQQRLSAAFPTSFLPTDSLGDATSNVYDLTVDHHGTSTNRRLLRSKTSRETLGATGKEKKTRIHGDHRWRQNIPFLLWTLPPVAKTDPWTLSSFLKNPNKDLGWARTNKYHSV